MGNNIIGATLYIVHEEWKNSKCDDGNAIRSLNVTKEGARETVLKAKQTIVSQWGQYFGYTEGKENNINPFVEGDLENGWEVSECSADVYELHDEDYSNYYRIDIDEMTVKK